MQVASPRPGAFRVGLLLLTAALLRTLPADAQSYTVLHAFDGTDGSDAVSALVPGSDGNLYGTTSSGGAFGGGTIFTHDAGRALDDAPLLQRERRPVPGCGPRAGD